MSETQTREFTVQTRLRREKGADMRQIRIEDHYASRVDLFVSDTYPTLEGLRRTLEILAVADPRAADAKPEDFVDLRFVEELKRTGFIRCLYGQ